MIDNHCSIFYYNEFCKITTWSSNVTASISSPGHNNGYLRPSLDVLDSPGVRRRSRHVAKLNMGEAKDDIHVCIMCLRAIMNNKVMEDPSEDLIAYISENMFAVFLHFGIMFQNHNIYCLYSRQLYMFVLLFFYENIVETHIVEGSPYVSCLRSLVRSFRRSVNQSRHLTVLSVILGHKCHKKDWIFSVIINECCSNEGICYG